MSFKLHCSSYEKRVNHFVNKVISKESDLSTKTFHD